MYNLKMIGIFLFLYPLTLFSTTYENASDKKIDGWNVLKQFSSGVVKNIYDKKKRSRVIKLDGNSTRTVYILMPKKKIFKRKKEEEILEWEMNYNEDFVIMIGINTIKGKRFLIYTSGDKNSYLQYGLGVDSSLGQWKKYRRNLQKDLEQSDHYNRFLNITNFVIKGSGMVDNIKIVNSKELYLKPFTPIKSVKKNNTIPKKLIEKSVKTKHTNDKNNTPPTIYIYGQNPMLLKMGELYVEPGAVAKNGDGSSVSVTISDDIDILKEGEYSVIYMATNSLGNSVIDQRRVIVGKIKKEKKSKNREKIEINEEELDQNTIDLEQRALEMLEWEKELAFREKELIEEKRSRDVTFTNRNYPSHPGL
jgi:hypothetical protein